MCWRTVRQTSYVAKDGVTASGYSAENTREIRAVMLAYNFSLNFRNYSAKLNKTEKIEALTQSELKNVSVVRQMNARISRTAA